ncbi:uncharacterized protein LOC111325380 [Stylophora pistillata]|nr:uncharacterized protein LOC111325380 [Stylophora pistillata]
MDNKIIIGHILSLVIQLLLSGVWVGAYRSYGCMEGKCAMEDCRSSSGSGRSNYCWIAADSAGNYMRCGRKEDCREAARSWGNCKAFSCFANRAPSPTRSYGKTCESIRSRKLAELKRECNSQGYSFESWARRYNTVRKLKSKFEPCVGDIIEEEAKKVIKYCHCYNKCGNDQTEKETCTVQGLDRRLDLEMDVNDPFKAVCAIDCDPEEKLEFLQKVINEHSTQTATKKVIITKGMSSSKTSSTGGSSSTTVSGEIGFQVMNVFSAKFGVSHTTGHNWNTGSTRTEFQQVTSEISIPVEPGDEVSVYQVVGECKNSDGTVFTMKTPTYRIKGKDGSTETRRDHSSEEQQHLLNSHKHSLKTLWGKDRSTETSRGHSSKEH